MTEQDNNPNYHEGARAAGRAGISSLEAGRAVVEALLPDRDPGDDGAKIVLLRAIIEVHLLDGKLAGDADILKSLVEQGEVFAVGNREPDGSTSWSTMLVHDRRLLNRTEVWT